MIYGRKKIIGTDRHQQRARVKLDQEPLAEETDWRTEFELD